MIGGGTPKRAAGHERSCAGSRPNLCQTLPVFIRTMAPPGPTTIFDDVKPRRPAKSTPNAPGPDGSLVSFTILAGCRTRSAGTLNHSIGERRFESRFETTGSLRIARYAANQLRSTCQRSVDAQAAGTVSNNALVNCAGSNGASASCPSPMPMYFTGTTS